MNKEEFEKIDKVIRRERLYANVALMRGRNGDYIYVTVVGKSISIVNDALNQSLAD